MPLRGALLIALFLGVGCATRVAVAAPPPHDAGTVLLAVEPRAYIGPFIGGSIYGTVENRTNAYLEIGVVLHLLDDAGSEVGNAMGHIGSLGPLTKARFEALWLTPKSFSRITWGTFYVVPVERDPSLPEPRYP